MNLEERLEGVEGDENVSLGDMQRPRGGRGEAGRGAAGLFRVLRKEASMAGESGSGGSKVRGWAKKVAETSVGL